MKKTSLAHATVIVAMDGKPVGTLAALDRAYEFRYFSTYERQDDALPLSLSYPLKGGPYSHSFAGELPPYFDHLLPEGWLRDVAKAAHLPMNSALEELASLCRDNIGAVEIYAAVNKSPSEVDAARVIAEQRSARPETSSFFVFDESGLACPKWRHCVVCLQALPSPGYNQNFHDACSEEFFGSKRAPSLALSSEALIGVARQQLGRHESLTGVQVKFSAVFAAGRNRLSDLSYIIKPEPKTDRVDDGVFYKNSCVAELASMHFAKRLNLDAAETALLYLSDQQPAIVSKRFDRQGGKIHTEDFAQILSIRDKYKGSYEKIGAALKRNSNSEVAKVDLERFLKAVLLNYVIGNCDAHLKNFSVIHQLEDGRPTYRLAPFYDILPVCQFAKKDPNQLGLTIEGKASKLTRDHFDKFAIRLGLNLTLIDAFLEELHAKIESFYETFQLFGVPKEFVDGLRGYCYQRFTDLHHD